VFIEDLDAAHGKPIAHPTVESPFVKHFIGNKQRQPQLRSTNRMLDLKPVAIAPRLQSRISEAPLELISIAQTKLTSHKSQRDRQSQPILENLAPAKWLHVNVQVVWRHSEILSPTESESNPNALVYRMTDVASQTQCTQEIEIKILRDWNGQLDVSPKLIVVLQRDN